MYIISYQYDFLFHCYLSIENLSFLNLIKFILFQLQHGYYYYCITPKGQEKFFLIELN